MGRNVATESGDEASPAACRRLGGKSGRVGAWGGAPVLRVSHLGAEAHLDHPAVAVGQVALLGEGQHALSMGFK